VLRLALPTGDLRADVASALASVGLCCEEYGAGSRALRLSMPGEDIAIRVFREKDIPIQVALGNYDLGICSAAWLAELESRYPQEDVTLLRPLAFGRRRLVAARASADVPAGGPVRIVSEYPGLADRFARHLRLPHYIVLPVWGAAEAYPPEDADLAVVSVTDERDLAAAGLEPVATIMEAPAVLIASRRSLARRDLGGALGRLLALPGAEVQALGNASGDREPRGFEFRGTPATRRPERRTVVRLAVPDGHAQRHTFRALAAAGLRFEGYEEKTFVRRPRSAIEGLEIKVIRPQDMPQQVAIGSFDLAITGRDWLLDHLYQFPSSPVVEAVDLGLSRYTITAAVSEDVPADDLAGAIHHWRAEGRTTIRVASEYPNIADHFARAHRLGRYQVVPVNGASEAFVPEDSEILIEGSETGSSFRANRLKPVERVFESTNCVIVRAVPPDGPHGRLVERLLEQLRGLRAED
jgi:ATP phosphoribosyltransferase